MAAGKDIKARIKSIRETMKLTRALKIVSAAKLKQAKNQLENTRPYFNRIEMTIADILSHDIYTDNIYFDKRKGKKPKKSAYRILTGDKGLCGSYNNNIFKFAERYLKRDPDSVLLICGHTGFEYFSKKGYEIMSDFFYPVYNPNVFRAREMQERIMNLFKEEKVDNVYLIYTTLKNAFELKTRAMRLIPLTFESLRKELGIKKIMEKRYEGTLIYEPSKKDVFEMLIPKYIKGVIYSALVEAFTSEQSARMQSMESASNNAKEMIDKLSLVYNRTRQNSITQEIIEMVAGFELLEE